MAISFARERNKGGLEHGLTHKIWLGWFLYGFSQITWFTHLKSFLWLNGVIALALYDFGNEMGGKSCAVAEGPDC